MVSGLVLGRPSTGYHGDLPTATGGRLTNFDDPRNYLAAADQIVADLQGSYAVSLPALAAGTHSLALVVSSPNLPMSSGTVDVTSMATPPRPLMGPVRIAAIVGAMLVLGLLLHPTRRHWQVRRA